MSGLDVAEVAAAQRSSVGVLTALYGGQPVLWAACVDDARQLPMVVSVLASRLLAALEAEPVDVEAYLRAWGADAAAWVAEAPPSAAPAKPAPVRLRPPTVDELSDATDTLLRLLDARTAGDMDGAAQLADTDPRHVLWLAVTALWSQLRVMPPQAAKIVTEGWRTAAEVARNGG